MGQVMDKQDTELISPFYELWVTSYGLRVTSDEMNSISINIEFTWIKFNFLLRVRAKIWYKIINDI